MKKFDKNKMTKIGRRILAALKEVARGNIIPFPEAKREKAEFKIV